MEHGDVIAYIYPHGIGLFADRASQAIEANPRHVPPRLQKNEYRYSRHERQSTEPPETLGGSDLDFLPCLAVRFSDIPRTNLGLIFGSHPQCDVVLRYPGISNRHFSFTFNESNYPIIRDLRSSMGTEVTYDREGEGMRRQFQWIIGGYDILQTSRSIIVALERAIYFQIVLPFHDTTSPAYIDKVNRFKQGAATAESLFGNLNLEYSETRLGTGAHSPEQGPIYLKRNINKGSFGVVTRLWNVSTGSDMVVKEPLPKQAKAIQRGLADDNDWRQEAYIMRRISHPNIVKLLESSFDPYPQLYLEYMPLGSLDEQDDISYQETLSILDQCLLALDYLHGGEKPIAHRDIKPENILVHHRSADRIGVKLADFGLSRDSSELMTMCGTRKYIAPEIYSQFERQVGKEARRSYTPAVDIWSLGVVACELVYGLPRYRDTTSVVTWCETIVASLRSNFQARPLDLGQLLLLMVSLSPEERLSARHCYEWLNAIKGTEDPHTFSVASSDVEEDDQTATLTYTPQYHGAEVPTTVVYQPSPGRAATSSYRVGSGAVPPGSFPSSSTTYETSDGSATSSSSVAQQSINGQHGGHGMTSEGSEASSSTVRQFINRQPGHELTYFLQDYSKDDFHPSMLDRG